MPKSPLEQAIDAAVRCVRCGAPLGGCDCWGAGKAPVAAPRRVPLSKLIDRWERLARPYRDIPPTPGSKVAARLESATESLATALDECGGVVRRGADVYLRGRDGGIRVYRDVPTVEEVDGAGEGEASEP